MKMIAMLLLCLPVFSFCQETNYPVNPETKHVDYTEVVKVDSASADDLYRKAKFFVADKANSATDITKLDDDVTKTVIVKGLLSVRMVSGWSGAMDGNARLKLTISAKDNRYKYSITEIVYETPPYGKFSKTETPFESDRSNFTMVGKKGWTNCKADIDKAINNYIADLKKHMSATQTDW